MGKRQGLTTQTRFEISVNNGCFDKNIDYKKNIQNLWECLKKLKKKMIKISENIHVKVIL